jgi:NAD(P)-dependent dehydrogenase (short-subunit alcohol dehydrogenase family)
MDPAQDLSSIFPPELAYDFTGKDTVHHDIYPSISATSTPSLRQYAHAGVSTIILVSRTLSQLSAVESEIKAIDSNIHVRKHAVDVKSEAEVAACAKAVTQTDGRLDILINNAGSIEPWVPIADSTPSKWWNTLEVNLRGPYLFLQAFLPLLLRTAETYKCGVDVVNVSSIGALSALVSGTSAYIISKAALLRLSEFAHAEYGDRGVNVVSLHPGGVLTELAAQEEVLRPCEFYPDCFHFLLSCPFQRYSVQKKRIVLLYWTAI